MSEYMTPDRISRYKLVVQQTEKWGDLVTIFQNVIVDDETQSATRDSWNGEWG